MKKTVSFYTLGCRVNQYETAAMEALFKENGYTILPFEDKSDVYVINTCTVTAESERKCRQILRRAKSKNPNAVVAAVGCMAQSSGNILSEMPEVDVIVGVTQKQNIVSAVEDVNKQHRLLDDLASITDYQEMKVPNFKERDRAFVKIQDGCDRFCSYCIIPYVRGKVRSRDPKNILSEIETLARNGFQEVVLTGIHVASFGRSTDVNLSKLIRMVSEIGDVKRIRLSSIDPTAFDNEMLTTYAEVEKLCPHFHISLQSGSTSVLRRMNRRYTAEEYALTINKLRQIRPDTAVTTDIITGFPGETEEEFAETLSFVEKEKLSGIHVFPYSIREGTRAAKLDGQLPRSLREGRAKTLIAKASELRHQYVKSFVGTVQDVLFEHKEGETSGFTPHFVRVLIEASTKESLQGKILPIKILDCKGDILYGKFEP